MYTHIHVKASLAAVLATLVLLCCLEAATWAQGDETAAGPPPAPVEVATVVTDSVSRQITLVGTTEAIAGGVIAAEISGLVESLPVSAGDRLEKGQRVAKLKSSGLALELEAAKASRDKAQANLTYATKELSRYTELQRSESVSRRKYDEVLYEKESWEHEVRRTTAAIELIEDNILKKTVAAPFPGFVAAKHTEVGEWLPAGGHIITLVDLRRIRLVVDVPERYAVQLQPSDPVRVTIPSLSNDPFSGQIYAVLPEGNVEARTIPVHVILDNPEFRIKSGMEARATFSLGDKVEALLVPKDAVLTAGGKKMVFVAADGIVRPVSVEVVGYHDSSAAVSGALNRGDQVVVRGNERLRPGQAVQIVTTNR